MESNTNSRADQRQAQVSH